MAGRTYHALLEISFRPVRVRGEVLVGNPEVLRSVHSQPDSLVPERMEPPFRGELREGARLVVAVLRKARQRLVAEDVDTAADPVIEARSFAETRHDVLLELDDPERRAQRDDGDRGRGAAGPVQVE